MSEECSLIAIFRLENQEVVPFADDETVRETVDSVDGLAEWGLEDVALILTIVGAEEHLTIIRANKDHAGGLRPAMAGEVRRDGASLLQIVDL